MKLINIIKTTKDVEYFGLTLAVPRWTSFIATDSDGKVYAYQWKPSRGVESWHSHGLDVQALGQVELEGIDWASTLVHMSERIVCKCRKGYASPVDKLCKFCREDKYCGTRRERLLYGVKHRGDGLPLWQLPDCFKVV